MGLDVVDDEEVEAEVHRIEDEEVAQIYEDAKDKHRKIMTGGFKSNTVLQLFMSKIQCMQCDALNGMHVEDVEDIKNTCTFCNLQLFVQ